MSEEKFNDPEASKKKKAAIAEESAKEPKAEKPAKEK